MFLGVGLDSEDAKIALESMKTGVYYYVNARTHHIDTLLKQAAKNRAKQVVILGAGYDSRAYRFYNEVPKVKFFEVDFPATLQYKKKKIAEIIASMVEEYYLV